MIKEIKSMILNIKTYPVLKWTLISNIILYAIVIGCVAWQSYKTRLLVEETIVANQHIIETISIESDGKQFIVKTKEVLKPLADAQKYEYKKFLEKYFEHQSYYLNFWLSILAIALGIFAIIVPICFVKFSEDKRKELNTLIKDCRQQKKQTEVNLKQIKEQLERTENLAKEVKANSITMQVAFYIAAKDYERAIKLLNISINIMPTVENLSYRAIVFAKQNNYQDAINDLERSLNIERKAETLTSLGCYYATINDYQKAKEYILESVGKDQQIAVNYYNLTEVNIMLGDISKAIEVLKEFIYREKTPYIFEDDKKKWIDKLKSLQQDEDTTQLLKTIDEKLQIRTREK